LTYASPLFEAALINAGVDEPAREKIYEDVMHKGSCQAVDAVPESVRHTFVVSQDITPEEHVQMQAALQRFVDNSISKTTNMPATATTDDVANAYMLAWELGCKGLTIYVTGSREKVVLETKATNRPRATSGHSAGQETPAQDAAGQDLSHGHAARHGVRHHQRKRRRRTVRSVSCTPARPGAIRMPFRKRWDGLSRTSCGWLRWFRLPSGCKKSLINSAASAAAGRSLWPEPRLSLPDGIARVLSEYLDNARQLSP